MAKRFPTIWNTKSSFRTAGCYLKISTCSRSYHHEEHFSRYMVDKKSLGIHNDEGLHCCPHQYHSTRLCEPSQFTNIQSYQIHQSRALIHITNIECQYRHPINRIICNIRDFSLLLLSKS